MENPTQTPQGDDPIQTPRTDSQMQTPRPNSQTQMITKNYAVYEKEWWEKSSFWLGIFLPLLSLLLTILIFFKQQGDGRELMALNQRMNSKIYHKNLILIGSGSVKNYLDEQGVFQKYYRHSDTSCLVIGNLPSSVCIQILKDESFPVQPNTAPWILMSAEPIPDSAFCQVEAYRENRRVVEVFLGYDVLQVRVPKKSPFAKGKEITCAQLKEFVRQYVMCRNHRVYTTSMGSATLAHYQKILGKSLLDSCRTAIFDLKTTVPEDSFLVLGSKYYLPELCDTKCEEDLYVIENKEPVKKELYLYFNAEMPDKEILIHENIKAFLDFAKRDFDTQIPYCKSPIRRDPRQRVACGLCFSDIEQQIYSSFSVLTSIFSPKKNASPCKSAHPHKKRSFFERSKVR